MKLDSKGQSSTEQLLHIRVETGGTPWTQQEEHHLEPVVFPAL